MFAAFAFKIKDSILLKMIRWNYQLTKQNWFVRQELCYYSTGFDFEICFFGPDKLPGLSRNGLLVFKNKLGYNLSVWPHLYKNLLSLKLETGCYFLKSILKKVLYSWANKRGHHIGSSLETWVTYHLNCNAEYSRISPIRTPKGQSEVSVLERCPYKRGLLGWRHFYDSTYSFKCSVAKSRLTLFFITAFKVSNSQYKDTRLSVAYNIVHLT